MKKKKIGLIFYGSATVGVKGQVVIPSKLRKDSNIKPRDPLIFIGLPKGNGFGVIKPAAMLNLRKKLEKLHKQLTENI